MRITLTILLSLVLGVAAAQKKGEIYTLQKLSQAAITRTLVPEAAGPKEKGDTTFTVYKGGSIELMHYFVNGDQYDNVFNPNPTGLVLNGQYFLFYCDIEKSFRQNTNNFLEIYEFEYLGRKYFMMENFREDCAGEGCRYRCYNLFDISTPSQIKQISFASIYDGSETFGEFNNDGTLDFVRIAPKAPANPKDLALGEHFLITAYSVNNQGKAVQLKNSDTGKQAYYIYGRGDEDAKQFEILQCDWFMPLKDTSGKVSEPKPYFPPYISFDPFYKYLYDPDGIRIEKNRWALQITSLHDLDAAKEYCYELREKGVAEVYIMIDQYGGQINFLILVGNYLHKDKAVKYMETLTRKGVKASLRDLNAEF